MLWKMRKEFGIGVNERWYEHEPKTVTENDSVTILWDMPIHTDRTIAANRPDIVLKNKEEKTCLLTDMIVHVPLDTDVHLSHNHGKAYQIQRPGNQRRLSERGGSKQ